MVFRRAKEKELERKILPHLHALYNYALALAGPGEADDLVQTTVLKAIERWQEIADRATVRTWLFVVLRNTWIDGVRQRARQEERVGTIPGWTAREPVPGPESQILEREWAQRVQQAVASLPEPYRSPLYLRDVEGFNYKEVAQILGCPLGTVMSRLARARALLRAQLLGQLAEATPARARKLGNEQK
ncbi:MAG: ECF RNA polymerase sigma factor SigR [Candidatus Binatia bacterium]|nr:MAG: ECF RNA polymerase sigma factor SigR [Candidatus Binatia bacterium]